MEHYRRRRWCPRALFLTISDAHVWLFDGQSLTLQTQLNKTRGASCFAFHRSIEMIESSVATAMEESPTKRSRESSLSSSSETASSGVVTGQ
jgi:hypothetical protein